MSRRAGQVTVPDADELVRRATGLVPLLRGNAARAAADRRLPAENLAALREAGLLGLTRPERFGGFEVDMRTKVAVLSEIARGCGSTAWVATLYLDAAFLLALFPDAVQDEVLAAPDALLTATLVPGGEAEPVDGGYVVSGRWPFNTGCLDADYAIQPAVIRGDGPPRVVHCLMPYDELVVEDDWHTSGMRGTGSHTVGAPGVFVPAERAVALDEVLAGRHVSERNAGSRLYRVPLLPYILTSGAATFRGLAAAARELFLERLPERGPVAYTGYARHLDSPATHHRVAEVTMKIEAADHLVDQAVTMVDDRSLTGEEYGPRDKPRLWGLVSYSSRLYTEAVETLRLASGASGINEGVPIQLVARDTQALATHAVMTPTTGIEHYGRALCGLDPSTPLLA